MAPLALLLPSLALPFLLLLLPFLRLLLRQRLSPLRLLPGPPAPSLLLGNLEEMHEQENTNLLARWGALYGPAYVYRGFLRGCRLLTTDPVAVAHILGNAYDYPKPDFVRESLATMAAGHRGLLTVEGSDHQRQRKILTPAFSASHIKSLTPIFWDKAIELRDIWLAQIDCNSTDNEDSVEPTTTTTTATETVRVDVLSWLGRATLDVIGLAGFGYTFNALTDNSHTDALARAFAVVFSTARRFRVMTILQVWFPVLRRFRRNSAAMVQAQATMRRIGLELIEEKRREAVADQLQADRNVKANPNPASTSPASSLSPTLNGTPHIKGPRDILSILIRSNLSSIAEQSMDIEEILCQISTFLAAGHETTASALTWCLYALTKNSEAQNKLRDAVRGIPETQGGEKQEDEDGRAALAERVARCEYLDWVVRESLRLHAPVTSTMRVCMRDEDEIPLQQGTFSPNKAGVTDNSGYVDKNGQRRWSIPVRKWDIISVPIQAINKSEAFWGPDAAVFRPERWATPPQGARAIPGLYSNTLTFLNGNPLGGNRACIGYKFALIEIKIFLYVLIKDIQFSIDPAMVIEKKVNVVTRPFVKSEPHLGNQMPLNLSRPLPSPSVARAAPPPSTPHRVFSER